MKTLPRCAWSGGLLVACAFLGNTPVQSNQDEPAAPDGVEVQVRGPVHEAFAQPNDPQVGPGQLVPKQPPAPIPEEPPEERPEGANVQFIPGYWAWDPESSQFMWVSGTYRNAPVGRQWVPGHWDRADDGWRWVPGYWAPENQQEQRFSPEPPAPLDSDPNIAPPGDDFSWVPGAWVYRETRFAWRPGYWSPFRVGRVWVGPRYYWTPRGYLFNDGYWDYPFEARGVLFAPVVFNRPYWNTPGWCWRPSFVVGFGGLFDSCFVRTGGFGFYFGNYYGPGCAGYGYRPWFNGYGRYNSAFAYHRWHNRYPNDWHARQRQLYDDRFAGRAQGPPRTFAQHNAFLNDKKGGNNPRMVAPLTQIKTVNNNVQLVKQTQAQVLNQKEFGNRTRELASNRAKGMDPIRKGNGGAPTVGSTTNPNFGNQGKPTNPGSGRNDGPRSNDIGAGPKVGKGTNSFLPKGSDGPRSNDIGAGPKVGKGTDSFLPKGGDGGRNNDVKSTPLTTTPKTNVNPAPKNFTAPSGSNLPPKTFAPLDSGALKGFSSGSGGPPKGFSSGSGGPPKTFSSPPSSGGAPKSFGPSSSPKSSPSSPKKSGKIDSFSPGFNQGPRTQSMPSYTQSSPRATQPSYGGGSFKTPSSSSYYSSPPSYSASRGSSLTASRQATSSYGGGSYGARSGSSYSAPRSSGFSSPRSSGFSAPRSSGFSSPRSSGSSGPRASGGGGKGRR